MGSLDSKIKKNIESLEASPQNPLFLDHIEKKLHKISFMKSSPSIIRNDLQIKVRFASLYFAKELIASKFEKLQSFVQKKTFLENWVSHSKASGFYRSFLNHQLKVLQDESLQKIILRIRKPLMNYQLEQLVRASLSLKKKVKITDQDIQALCLSAFLHPLRQTIGSCFATAPAIQIQMHQPELFFKDLQELLNLGQLKRVYEGVEYSIPMSFTFAPSAMKEPFKLNSAEHWMNSIEAQTIAEQENWFLTSGSEEEKKVKVALKLKGLDLDKNWNLEEILKFFLLQKPKRSSSQKMTEVFESHLSLMPPLNTLAESNLEPPGYSDLQLHVLQLYDNLLLKSWEYTLASFSESKTGFYKWNLYTSLGLSSDEKDGIGQAIYQYLEEAIEKGKQKVEDYHRKYEEEFYQVKFLESRLKNTESTQMEGWARVEYQNHVNEMNHHLNTREDQAELVERISKLLPEIVKALDELFPKYFLELYDAQMQDYKHPFHEDAPAGFRLIYKHGRADPLVWTRIKDEEQFSASIKDFFLLIENELRAMKIFEGLEEQISEIVTVVVRKVQSEAFIESAYQRVCQRYKYPYDENQTKTSIPYKPWAYLSGGTLTGLLQHYFQREKALTLKSQKVASPTELLSFLIEVIRELPHQAYENFLGNSFQSLLMTSPNHAFSFQPALLPLRDIWEDKNFYSYSWIRDAWSTPCQNFLLSIQVQPVEMKAFIDTYLGYDPYLVNWFQGRVHLPNYSLSLVDFRKLCCQYLPQLPTQFALSGLSEEKIDSWIYEFFPYISNIKLTPTIEKIIHDLSLKDLEKHRLIAIAEKLILEKHVGIGLSSKQLFHFLQACFLFDPKVMKSEVVDSMELLKVMQKHKACMPEPLYWADTNWPFYHFAFFLDLQNLRPSLWRMEKWGRSGFPMQVWDSFFSEENPSKWTIYTQPNEYVFDVGSLKRPQS